MAMWRCAKATTSQEFIAVMERISQVNPHAWEYLNRIPSNQWSRSGFSEYLKSDNYTNNNCKSFNSRIKKMREKPIITMLLAKEKRESSKWRPFPIGDDLGHIYEVQCLPHKIMVDIEKRTCSCRFWQLIGLPCRHACAVFTYQNRRPEEYAHNWLSMGAYNSTYLFVIQPISSQ
ncbi:hypothetical protein AHAS_Ahas05G0069800 [Arachis hypogaea]